MSLLADLQFPYKSISMRPSHHKGKIGISVSWVDPLCIEGDLYVYRSLTGLDPFELCNETPFTNLLHVEAPFENPARNVFPQYRLLLVYKGQKYPSPILGVYDDFGQRRHEFLLYANVCFREFQRMKLYNGVPMLHYGYNQYSDELSDNVDPDTGQREKDTSCEDDESGSGAEGSGTGDLGTSLANPYSEPIPTIVEVLQRGATPYAENASGHGRFDPTLMTLRSPAFPPVKQRDVFLHPPTDNRWQVTSEVKPNMFKGTCPVSWTFQVSLLPKNDPFYKVVPPYSL